ncbi:MAG: hypothetical protein JHC98_09800 [Thermoleophilaceae bacterium]|nr:hypothetical protein [Thermoleophilaceae bacterium]
MRKFALSVLTTATTFCLVVAGSAFGAVDPADKTPPTISNIKVTNKIFKVGTKNTALITNVTSAAKKKKAPIGTKIKFDLLENAYIAIAVFKAVEGRTQGKDCVKPTPELENAKKCARPVFINTMQRIGKPGPNSISFSGRLDGKKLKPGAYGFGVIATDESGNSTPIVLKNFIIVKG